MELCITTDYEVSADIPRADQLGRMRAAGFRYVHWCYDWADNVIYGEAGLAAIRALLDGAGLQLVDTHGVCWGGAREFAADPAQRAHAVELHRDRLRMTAALGGDTVVIHPATGDDLPAAIDRQIESLRELEPLIRELGVSLSIENTWPASTDHAVIPALFDAFPPAVMGFCLDSGHANLSGNLDWLIEHAFERLTCLHLHDNDGQSDQHRLPGMGTVPWEKLAPAILATGYAKPLNFELSLKRSNFVREEPFLAAAHTIGTWVFA